MDYSKRLSEDEEVLRVIQEKKVCTAREIADILGKNVGSVVGTLCRLKFRGKIRTFRTARSTLYLDPSVPEEYNMGVVQHGLMELLKHFPYLSIRDMIHILGLDQEYSGFLRSILVRMEKRGMIKKERTKGRAYWYINNKEGISGFRPMLYWNLSYVREKVRKNGLDLDKIRDVIIHVREMRRKGVE